MMTLKENTTNSTSQTNQFNSNPINRSYSTIGYNYHHHNPWDKPTYATFNYPQTPYSIGTISSSTGGASSLQTMNKTNSAFDISLNPSSFYRRHTESALPTSTSIYSTSTTNHPSPSPFNYSHATTHYHPSDLFFGWNNNPSLLRTQSASFRDFPQTSSYPDFNSIYSSTTKSTNRPLNTPATANNYPTFFNTIPPMNIPLQSSIPSNSLSQQKRSIHSVKKSARLPAQLRNEILKLKATKPTVFVWEIQQMLLQNGICTAQTLPHATDIQRILNKSNKSLVVKQEPKDLIMQNIINNIENKPSPPVTICLSPAQSPALSNSDTTSECSICLETYRSGQEVSILSCSHEYHSSCIKSWMMKSRSCPMCRKDIQNQPQFVTLLI